MRVVFSGIQPSNTPHIGNYLGTLKKWVQLCSEPKTELFYSVVDLHALTVPQQSKDLKKNRNATLTALLAVGIDPKVANIYYQSQVPQHSQLMWILTNFVNMGRLNRMTQWKDKMNLRHTANVSDSNALQKLNLGLFSYPVLMAADILVYKTTHVPVGEDQLQHLELARWIASSFNSRYNQAVFPMAEPLLTPTKRIMSLRDPTKKMSKSDANPLSTILLTDDSTTISKKVMKAVTDANTSITYDPQARPGVSSLVEMLASLKEQSVDETVKAFESASGHKVLKEALIDALNEELTPIRERYSELKGSPVIDEISEESASKARAVASEVLCEVQEVIGL
ncbi:hypothetical protein CANCADRAFT_643 [Tortispora caseinolytica NRRL Y-17796]|uniref:Tryptophan--tRNA ligase, mitochondrial n=1 Tax=Tortispora caseinolytica NRRL Y-17796 TaxID=767744 RepID=A0A1E4TK09_9ASCO|nr:hypothetical protein CANCADRAFT_643 [Tortispora caseinolytica NRRL Y-17796]